jgi:hypothetical protein
MCHMLIRREGLPDLRSSWPAYFLRHRDLHKPERDNRFLSVEERFDFEREKSALTDQRVIRSFSVHTKTIGTRQV